MNSADMFAVTIVRWAGDTLSKSPVRRAQVQRQQVVRAEGMPPALTADDEALDREREGVCVWVWVCVSLCVLCI